MNTVISRHRKWKITDELNFLRTILESDEGNSTHEEKKEYL